VRQDGGVQVTTPSEQGVAPQGIERFLDALEADPAIEPQGLVIHRHGARIAEAHWAPHDGTRRRLVYSLSKTFTGTALGLLVGEGRLSLDDLVSDHLPELFDDETPAATRRMRIRHIASMATGHDRETLLEATAIDRDDPVRGFLRIPPDAEPGTLFMYNQPPVLALATILQRLAGERLTEYLRPRVLDPIGITDLAWSQQRPGVDLGYSGVHTTVDAAARLGQLYLDDGVWDGTRLLPEGWVASASSVQIENPARLEPDWRCGYGFQLWMQRHGYRGDGAFGQYMVVLPDHDAVLALFSCTEDMQVILDMVWEHLLPAMTDARRAPTDADAALAARLAGVVLPTVAERNHGEAPDVTAMTFTPGTIGARSQRSVTSVDVADGRLTIREDDVAIELPLTIGWTTVGAHATNAAQLADGRIGVDVSFLETPHRLELALDPATATFVTRWPHVPLGTSRLSSMRAPAS
jgi:CubicO group peptidase (beta-lactamase class C family)